MHTIETQIRKAVPSAKPEAVLAAWRCVEDVDGMGLGHWLERFGMREWVTDAEFAALQAEVDRIRSPKTP